MLEDIETFLEVTLLEERDLSLTLLELLTLLTSIAELAGKQAICAVEVIKAKEENCLFSKSLLGATIQDGSIRERRVEA